MRILYLTNGFPFPLTSGYLRHYFLMRELCQRHSITLLSLVKDSFVSEHADALAPFTEKIQTFPLQTKSRIPLPRSVRNIRLFAGAEPGVRKMRQTVAELTSREKFDVAVFSGKHTLPALAPLGRTPVVADICDAASVRMDGRMQHVSPLHWPRLMLGRAFMRRVERKLVSRASHLLFASCRDREALMENSDKRATVVPNGVDLDFWSRSARRRGTGTIVFTGAMHYPPNVDAALHLIEDILPLVRKQLPDTQVKIVGRDPTPALVQAGKQPGITVTGFVDDVRPYLEEATVFAAPLRFGAGIQNKVLEAMAMEVPVVSSTLAADGLRTEEGDCPPLRTADRAQDFANEIVVELTAGLGNPTPHAEGRRYVARHFVWSRAAEKVERAIDSVKNQ